MSLPGTNESDNTKEVDSRSSDPTKISGVEDAVDSDVNVKIEIYLPSPSTH